MFLYFVEGGSEENTSFLCFYLPKAFYRPFMLFGFLREMSIGLEMAWLGDVLVL